MPSKVKTVFDADVQRALDKQQRLLVKQQEQINSLKTLNKTSKDTQTSFDGATSSALKFAASAVSIAAVSAALEKVDARAKQAGQSLLQQEATRQSLAQIQADPKIAERLSTTLGLTVTQAQKTLFSGISAGFDVSEIQDISQKLRPIATELDQFFNIIQQQQLQFGEVAGTPTEILNRLLKGASVSPLTVEQLGPESSKTLAAITAISGTPAEAIAASAIAAKAQEPARAVTEIRALASALSNDPSKLRLGLTGGVEALLAEHGGDIQTAQLSLSEQRARGGFSVIAKNLELFKSVTSQIEQAVAATGTPESPLSLAQAAAEKDPHLQVILGRKRAKAEREVAFLQEGARENVQEAIFDVAIAGQQELVNQGLSDRFKSFILDTIIFTLDKITSDPAIAERVLRQDVGVGVTSTGPVADQMRETNKLMAEQLEIWKNFINQNSTETRVVPNSAIE